MSYNRKMHCNVGKKIEACRQKVLKKQHQQQQQQKMKKSDENVWLSCADNKDGPKHQQEAPEQSIKFAEALDVHVQFSWQPDTRRFCSG